VSSAPFEACNRPDYVFRKVDTYDAQGEQSSAAGG